MWDDPDPDTVPWCTGDDSGSSRHAFYGLSCPVYAFAPNSGHFSATEWPKSYKVKGDTFVLIRDGRLNETDHECNCHGNLVEWMGAVGEPTKPISAAKVLKWLSSGKATNSPPLVNKKPKFFWDFSGDSSDKPYPDCERCDGDGYINASGGEWALYALKEA